MNFNKTICALSTPKGTGGIAVIRISGEKAFEITNKVFKAKNKKDIFSQKSHTVSFGNIVNKNGFSIDEVLITKFVAPHSFTGEDVIEISCHGGMAVVRAILKLLIENGASPAQGGEFSKRAFLNGKIDLSQAEAIIDIINAKDEYNLYSGENQLNGILSDKINSIREKLIDVLSNIYAVIDYPDEEIDEEKTEKIIEISKDCLKEIEKLKKSYDTGKIIRDGASIVICGKPNVGKSSLLNALLKEERAIVTNIAGTTRDIIEEEMSVDGLKVKITDTAGIRYSDDQVENIGIKKALDALNICDMVLFILDGSLNVSKEDIEIAEKIKNKKVFIVINKIDISNDFDIKEIKKIIPDGQYISVSAKENEGIDELSENIKNSLLSGKIDIQSDLFIKNERHMESLVSASEHLKAVIDGLTAGMFPDIVTIDMEATVSALGSITGQTVSEEIVSNIFKKFCVGK